MSRVQHSLNSSSLKLDIFGGSARVLVQRFREGSHSIEMMPAESSSPKVLNVDTANSSEKEPLADHGAAYVREGCTSP